MSKKGKQKDHWTKIILVVLTSTVLGALARILEALADFTLRLW